MIVQRTLQVSVFNERNTFIRTPHIQTNCCQAAEKIKNGLKKRRQCQFVCTAGKRTLRDVDIKLQLNTWDWNSLLSAPTSFLKTTRLQTYRKLKQRTAAPCLPLISRFSLKGAGAETTPVPGNTPASLCGGFHQQKRSELTLPFGSLTRPRRRKTENIWGFTGKRDHSASQRDIWDISKGNSWTLTGLMS